MNYAELMRGMPDGRIAPLATTTRAETATVLQRYITGFIGDDGFDVALVPLAAHVDAVGHWTETYISFVFARGIMIGIG